MVTRKASSTDIAKKPKTQKRKGAGKGAVEGAAAVNDDPPVLVNKTSYCPTGEAVAENERKQHQNGGEPQDALKQL